MKYINNNFIQNIKNINISKEYITFGLLTLDNFKHANYQELTYKLEEIFKQNLIYLEIIYFDKNKLVFSFKNYNTDESYRILNNLLKNLKKINKNKISISALNIKRYEINDKKLISKSNLYLNIFKKLKKNMSTDNELIIVNKF